MSQYVKIPGSMRPFVVTVNGAKYEYPTGETVEVPDHIAEIIRQYEQGNCPEPAAPATKPCMVSPDGKTFAVTINNDGELTAAFVKFGAPFTFYLAGKEYTALAGMTWRQWLDSEYNTSMTSCGDCGGEHSECGVSEDDVYPLGGCNDGVPVYDAAPVYSYSSVEDMENGSNGIKVLADNVINSSLIYSWYG